MLKSRSSNLGWERHTYGAAVVHLTKLLISAKAAKLKELTRVLEIVLMERAVNFTNITYHKLAIVS